MRRYAHGQLARLLWGSPEAGRAARLPVGLETEGEELVNAGSADGPEKRKAPYSQLSVRRES